MFIGFSKAIGFKPFSWAIRAFEKTEYSHVYVKFNNNYTGINDIYQASKSMVNTCTEPTFLEHNIVVKEFQITIDKDKKRELIIWLKTRLGKPYSLKAILYIFLHKIGFTWFNKIDGEEAFVCSELVYRLLKAKINLNGNDLGGKDEDFIDPKQVYEVLEKLTNNQ